MANEFTAVIERDGDWLVAYCPEIPGANGQGKTKQEALDSLSAAISLILEDRREGCNPATGQVEAVPRHGDRERPGQEDLSRACRPSDRKVTGRRCASSQHDEG